MAKKQHGKKGRKSKKFHLLTYIREHIWLTIGIVVAGIVGIVMLFIEISPALRSIRDSFLYNVFVKFLISAVLLYFTWFYKKRPTLPGKILATVAVLPLWTSYVIESAQIRLLIVLALCFVLLAYVLYRYLWQGEKDSVLIGETIWFFFINMFAGSDYAYLRSPNGLHYWEIGLVVGIAVGVIATILLIMGAIQLKNDRLSEEICLVILAAALSFAMACFTADNLNYALDTEPPKDYVFVIEDKQTSGSKHTTYKLYFDFHGERIRLDVSRSEYQDTEIGDRFYVSYYEGAFDDPFFIPKRGK